MADRLAYLARSSGTFAMLALDQRESLRTMLAAGGGEAIPDERLSRFKVAAARALTPHASAVLLDVPLGLRPALDANAIAIGCGIIVAGDRLDQARGGPVEDTDVDDAVLADDEVARVADAYKLLVIWRPDRDWQRRADVVHRFVAACRAHGRPAIVEGIVRPAPGNGALTGAAHADAVVAAARELGRLADLYKAEVPTLGAGSAAEIAAAAGRVSAAVGGPWVVLSNGTPTDRFAYGVEAACAGGASGFLAGRAIWADAFEAPDVDAHLDTVSAPRLAALAALVDRVGRPWRAVAGGAR